MAKIKRKELIELVEDIGICIARDVLNDPVADMDTYNKYKFNANLDELKPKVVKEVVGRAKTALDFIRAFDLDINSRIYNMLRYLEDHR